MNNSFLRMPYYSIKISVLSIETFRAFVSGLFISLWTIHSLFIKIWTVNILDIEYSYFVHKVYRLLIYWTYFVHKWQNINNLFIKVSGFRHKVFTSCSNIAKLWTDCRNLKFLPWRWTMGGRQNYEQKINKLWTKY